MVLILVVVARQSHPEPAAVADLGRCCVSYCLLASVSSEPPFKETEVGDIIACENDHPHTERRERYRCPSAGRARAGEAGLHRYAMTGQGDVKALQGRDGFRLRIGSFRVIFDEDATTILAIYIGRQATTTYKRS